MSGDGGQDIFATSDSVFENRKLLRIGHVPELGRVVGRDAEISDVGSALAPATTGGPPETIIIYGRMGTGKSLVARAVTRQARKRARGEGHSLEYSYVDCSDFNTQAKASREMARGLRDNLDVTDEKKIPRVGIGGSDYRDITWELLREHDVEAFVVILDEIDQLDDEDALLNSLSRAKETGKAETFIGVIGISNKIEYREQLSERVDSSLQDNELVFDPYDADQLRNILDNRTDAFSDGVLDADVIPKVAAKAAREHGDARKAVETLYEAGRLAEKNDDRVTVDYVDEALTKAEVKRFRELVKGQTLHVKYILRALAALSQRSEVNAFRTTEVYDVYEQHVTSEGSDPLSYDRVSRLLKEQAFLGITESEHTGGGNQEGSYSVHRLARDPDLVLEALTDES